jgi:hypothetical protein
MEPIAYGFMVMMGAAAFLGVLVGAIGGAVIWRLRINVALGAVLTAGALLLVLIASHHGKLLWLRAELTWGAPSMALAFLICSVSARWIAARTSLHPNWSVLAALGVTFSTGFLYLMMFRLHFRAPLLAALIADVFLILLLIRSRGPVR